jgi:hypothetical protein
MHIDTTFAQFMALKRYYNGGYVLFRTTAGGDVDRAMYCLPRHRAVSGLVCDIVPAAGRPTVAEFLAQVPDAVEVENIIV